MQTISREQVDELREALAVRGVTMEWMETGERAFARLVELTPPGATVQTGSSTTLEQIGFCRWLFQQHESGRLRYFRAEGYRIKDASARTENRRASTLADYFMGSVNALTLAGEAVAADNSGSRVGGYVFGAKNVIWVVGFNKIVPTLEEALRRVWEVALPREDNRVRSESGAWAEDGSSVGKLVIFHREAHPNRIRMLLVGEELGF